MLCIPWTPTDEARQFARDVADALDAAFPRNRGAQADALGLALPDLSMQLACVKPFNAWRLTRLKGDAATKFWDALLATCAEHQGGLYLKPDLVMLLRGAAVLRRKPAKALLRSGAERKSA